MQRLLDAFNRTSPQSATPSESEFCFKQIVQEKHHLSGHIFNLQKDGKLVEMDEQPFDNEDIFQELIERYPNLLAGDQINSTAPRRWLLVRREMGIPAEEQGSDRWSLDHLFIDQDAIPTLVEVKRSSDTRIRREVVGQVLDYAANAVVYWPVEKLVAEFEKQCQSDGIDPKERLGEFLGEDYDAEEFWQLVKTNLQAGRVRLLFVADVIPSELRRIVEFLNTQMDPAEVLAVEIKHYVGTGLKTLVPRVIGQTAEAEVRKGTTGKRKPNLSEEELHQIAKDRGVGDLYASIVTELRPLFDAVTTTQSNIAFNGKLPKAKSGGTILAILPRESDAVDGVYLKIYIDRLSEFFKLEKRRVVDLLPTPENNESNADWAGDIFYLFIKQPADLQPLVELMQQATQQG